MLLLKFCQYTVDGRAHSHARSSAWVLTTCDFLQSEAEGVRDQAAQRFQKLNKAYEVLRDPDQRRKYDSGQSL